MPLVPNQQQRDHMWPFGIYCEALKGSTDKGNIFFALTFSS